MAETHITFNRSETFISTRYSAIASRIVGNLYSQILVQLFLEENNSGKWVLEITPIKLITPENEKSGPFWEKKGSPKRYYSHEVPKAYEHILNQLTRIASSPQPNG